ncbi:hypothetical protein JK361_39550 [Streptomyces sp. 5-8]|uniref:Uncharacterized protein n=1 Tax=Streptomyces musisoli TaxID=2802280 RepID=A0ABS1PEL3_9ACTN|nr:MULTISPECIES: hypothetical protein [Streptomyces]MBL1110574.1 hypothetical protein [Streptomyces musisoli]MBY8846231.1 hypothetical protein [Streptomyces sp. SP2-10]
MITSPLEPSTRWLRRVRPVLWWVGSFLALLWALMFCLPKQTNSKAD